jgi:hypothetical protein
LAVVWCGVTLQGSASFEEFVLATASFCLAYDLIDFINFALRLFDW